MVGLENEKNIRVYKHFYLYVYSFIFSKQNGGMGIYGKKLLLHNYCITDTDNWSSFFKVFLYKI